MWTLCIQPIYSINHPAGADRPTRWQKTLLDKTTHTQKRNETTTTHDTRLEKFDPIWHNPAEGTFHGRTFKLQKGLQSPAGRWTNNMFNSLVPEDPDLWFYSGIEIESTCYMTHDTRPLLFQGGPGCWYGCVCGCMCGCAYGKLGVVRIMGFEWVCLVMIMYVSVGLVVRLNN